MGSSKIGSAGNRVFRMQFEKQEVSFLQKSLISSLFLLLIFSCVPTVTQGQDIIFDDDPSPPVSTSMDAGSQPAERRPQYGFPYQRPRPFQNFNLNGIVRNPIEAFASGFQSLVQNLGSPTFTLSGSTTEEPIQEYEEPVSDCRTFRNTGGYCMPLESCEALQRLLANRPQVSVNRILRRSICGFSGFNSLVCCPEAKGNIISIEEPPRQPTPPPFLPTSRPSRPPSFDWTTTTAKALPTTRPPPISIPSGDNIDIRTGCGFSNASHSRIVGGKEAQKGAWPWIAAIGFQDPATGNTNYLCGGALIGKRHILTAAHCCFNRNDLKTVRLGDHNLYSNDDGVTPLNLQIEQILISPKYNSKTHQNDIAILVLQLPVEFTAQVHPICLPASSDLRRDRFENKTPFVAGWGAIEFNGPSSAVLRETQLPVVPDAECQSKYKQFKNSKVDDTNICAGLQRGGRDTCQGDSGGPLMQPINSEQYVQIGVVSFGFKCAEPGFPGVYSRVTSHMDWIEDTVRSTTL